MDFEVAARTYLESFFVAGEVPRASELAAHLGLKPWALTRVFERTVGLPPSWYLKREQVAHAERLLRTTSLPIEAIARSSGFASTRSLYRSYRRFKSTAPRGLDVGEMVQGLSLDDDCDTPAD